MSDLHKLYDQADRLKDEGKYEEAVAELENILKLDETFALAHSALAVLLGKVGKHEEAIVHGQRVCELEPNDPFSFTALSVTCQRAFAGTNQRAYIQMAEDAMARSQTLQGGG
ncbi:MAG: tetratricopeptide repeat protein [Pirellulales bacterium]